MTNEYWSCRECSYGVSGPVGPTLDQKIDDHTEETGHLMTYEEITTQD